MKIVVLDRSSMGYDIPMEKLKDFGEVTIYDKTAPDECAQRISNADVVILNKVKLTDTLIDCAKSLKLICVFATGYDNIDIESARTHGVAVCNVPAYSTDSVVLFTVGTALSLYAKLPIFDEYTKSGSYTQSNTPNLLSPVYHTLRGKTWGIVGYGNIGKSVGKVARALGARVIAYKRTPVNEVECLPLDTVLSESDIITLHIPLCKDTAKIINEGRIALIKNNAILVNEARGGIIDEAAITEAVLDGKIAGYGCDVYTKEPFDSDHPYNKLIGLKNVILTPHCAWASYESRCSCLQIICDNIASFIDNKTLNRVDI